ncbi:unnamed protein product [Tenebrio molitor]|nr:unnamed protein product [Tenebrio molitor]
MWVKVFHMTCQSLKFLLLIQNGGRKIGRVVPTTIFGKKNKQRNIGIVCRTVNSNVARVQNMRWLGHLAKLNDRQNKL